MQRCEATDRKPHGQGRAMLLAMAHGSQAHRYAPCRPRRASGPTLRQASTVHWTVDVRAQPTVNAALVHRLFAHRAGEICAPWRCGADGRDGWVVPYLRRPGARSRSPISSEPTGPDLSDHTARPAVMHGVRPQKSAEAIVVFQCFTRVAEHEGPNMRSRAEQWVARGSTINPTGLVECGAGPRCRSCAHSVRSP